MNQSFVPVSYTGVPDPTGVVWRFINEEQGGVEGYLEGGGVTREQQRGLKKLLLVDLEGVQ